MEWLYFDGGGSSLKVFRRLAFSERDGVRHLELDLLHRISGNFNFHSGDRETIIATLRSVLNTLQARFPDTQCMIGLAGLFREEDCHALSAQFGERQVYCVSDLELVFRLCFEHSDGAVCILGTGSIAAARVTGKLITVGGYGPIFGDDGSAKRIGQRLCRFLLRYWDGRAVEEEFRREYAAFEQFSYGSVAPTRLHSGLEPEVTHLMTYLPPTCFNRQCLLAALDASDIFLSSLTPLLGHALRDKNRIAEMIFFREARAVSDMLEALRLRSEQLTSHPFPPVYFWGGLVEGIPEYLTMIKSLSEGRIQFGRLQVNATPSR